MTGPGQDTVLRFTPETTALVLRIPRRVVDAAIRPYAGALDTDTPLRFEPVLDPARRRGAAMAFARAQLRVDGRLGPADPLPRHRRTLRTDAGARSVGVPVAQPERRRGAARRTGRGAGGACAGRWRSARSTRRSSISVADIAAASHMSVRTLQEKFRTHLGVTPLAHLRHVRLAGAHADLLAVAEGRSDDTVTGIALRWGFSHLGRFGSLYRAAYGRLPSQTTRMGGRGTVCRRRAPPGRLTPVRHRRNRIRTSGPGGLRGAPGPVLSRSPSKTRLCRRGSGLRPGTASARGGPHASEAPGERAIRPRVLTNTSARHGKTVRSADSRPFGCRSRAIGMSVFRRAPGRPSAWKPCAPTDSSRVPCPHWPPPPRCCSPSPPRPGPRGTAGRREHPASATRCSRMRGRRLQPGAHLPRPGMAGPQDRLPRGGDPARGGHAAALPLRPRLRREHPRPGLRRRQARRCGPGRRRTRRHTAQAHRHSTTRSTSASNTPPTPRRCGHRDDAIEDYGWIPTPDGTGGLPAAERRPDAVPDRRPPERPRADDDLDQRAPGRPGRRQRRPPRAAAGRAQDGCGGRTTPPPRSPDSSCSSRSATTSS
ncbi:helix-turn-helix transcriptional regulator [Yinghuangia aomiensis]